MDLTVLISNFLQVDFNAEGAGGRLRFLRDRFIIGDRDKDSSINLGGLGDISLTALRSKSSPFGRPPKIPTQTTFSQRGTYGQGEADRSWVIDSSPPDSLVKQYTTLAYGEIPNRRYDPDTGEKAFNKNFINRYEDGLQSPGDWLKPAYDISDVKEVVAI